MANEKFFRTYLAGELSSGILGNPQVMHGVMLWEQTRSPFHDVAQSTQHAVVHFMSSYGLQSAEQRGKSDGLT